MDLQAMDLAEVRNLVKWLDEQQRIGRKELATVQQQYNGQQREMSEIMLRVQELEERFSSSQTQVARLIQVDQQLDNLRAEVVHLIEQSDDRRIQSEKEMERLRLVEHQAHTRTLNELQGEMAPLPRLVEEMEQRKAEDERLSTSVATLQNQALEIAARIEERVRDVTYLEEAQRQDARRIAELQQGSIEINKRADDIQAKQLTADDILKRNEARLERLTKSELERKQQAVEFIEQGKLADQRRMQELDRWTAKLEESEELMAGYARQWRLFEEQHRLNKEATGDLQEFKKRLERRQTELAETQRVEDERMKQQWTEFLAEEDKRQKQRGLEQEQWVNEQIRQRENFLEHLQALRGELDQAAVDIKSLFVLQEKYADTFRQLTRIWLEGYESVVTPPITRKIPG